LRRARLTGLIGLLVIPNFASADHAWLPVGRERTGPVGWMSHLGEVRADGSDFKIAGWLRLPNAPKPIAPHPGLTLWRLTNGDLPIPYVDWRHRDLLVHATLVCGESVGQPISVARWSIYNEGHQPHEFELLLAVIPLTERATHSRSLREGNVLVVNGREALICRPGALALEAMGAERHLRFRATVPPRSAVPFDFVLPRPTDRIPTSELVKLNFNDEHARAVEFWRTQLFRDRLQLPDERFAEAYRASGAFERLMPQLPRAKSLAPSWPLLRAFIENQCAAGVFGWCDAFDPTKPDHEHTSVTGRAWQEYAARLRSALYLERDHDMVLAPGVPAEWLEHPRPLRLMNELTRFGLFELTMNADPRRRRLTIRLTGEAAPLNGFVLRLPEGWRATRLIVDGREQPIGDELRFSGGARRVEVLYSRAK